MHHALITFKESKGKVRELRKNRGFFRPKTSISYKGKTFGGGKKETMMRGKGKSKSKGRFKGKGKGKDGDGGKNNDRCFACGRLGHHRGDPACPGKASGNYSLAVGGRTRFGGVSYDTGFVMVAGPRGDISE
jgi:hypothetical protein